MMTNSNNDWVYQKSLNENHFLHNQKHAKKIKRSIKKTLSRNGCTVTSNDTFQMLYIPISEIPKTEAVDQRCFIKQVLLKISQNSQEGTSKIDLKM